MAYAGIKIVFGQKIVVLTHTTVQTYWENNMLKEKEFSH